MISSVFHPWLFERVCEGIMLTADHTIFKGSYFTSWCSGVLCRLKSFIQLGQVFQSRVKITQDLCKIWIQIWKLKKVNSVFKFFVPTIWRLDTLKNNIQNYPRKCFWTKEEKRGLNFNPEVALIRLWTTGPRRISLHSLSLFFLLLL